MDIVEHHEADILFLAPAGRIDHETAGGFHSALEARIDGCDDGAGVVLDLAQVEYMSSVGLRVLMVVEKKAKARSVRIAVCSLQPVMGEIFAISRFDRVFDVYESRDTAAAALAGAEPG